MRLNILHLSDVHLNNEKLNDFLIVRAALRSRIASLIEEKGRPDVVVFSGDLVQAGARLDNFEFAYNEFIEPVLLATKITREQFFIVPGNHDIDRETVRNDPMMDQGQRNFLKNREALNDFITKNLDGSQPHHFARLLPYTRFIDKFQFARAIRRTPFFTTHQLTLPDKGTLGIACLNTAWRASGEADDIDYGRLLLGERTIFEALGDIRDCDSKIAIFHHPLFWLPQFEQDDCRPLLLKEFDLILNGHCHRSRPEYVETPTGKAVMSEGGALYVNRQYFNGFCWIEYSKDEGEARFSVWRYEDTNAIYSFVPATNVAPSGNYLIRLNTQVEVTRFATTEGACRLLLPVLQELANEHMLSNYSDSTAPKRLEDLYVSLPLKGHSQFSSATKDTSEVSEEDLFQTIEPVIIYGPRESGKTTLALHLCLAAASAERKRIPIYIDLSKLKAGSHYILRAINRFASDRALGAGLEDHLSEGHLLIVFDNLSNRQRDTHSHLRKLAMVEEFVERYNKNSFVFLADETAPVAARLSKRETLKIAHRQLYIHPLRRSGIRELTKRWLEPSGLYTPTNVRAVLDKLSAFNLPRTAHVVSMVLWTIEREKSAGPVNEASLLQRFVEANLNKANLADIDRSSLDFVIKEAFLSHLAIRLKDSDLEYIDKNDLVQFTIDFFKARSWHHDAAAFVDDLIQVGVLVQFTDEEGTFVGFRFRCLRDYFGARFLQDNKAYVDEVFAENKYINFVRELDIMTGLIRNNPDVIKNLSSAVRAYQLLEQFNPQAHIAYFNSFKMKLWKPEAASFLLATDVQEAGATDSEINTLIDQIEERPNESEQAPQEQTTGEGVAVRESALLQYFLTNLLLSKVVRNNELLDDESLKLQAINLAIESWCWFAAEPALRFDQIFEKIPAADIPPETIERFSNLSDATKAQVEFVLKCLLHVILSYMAYESIGTEKLYVVLKKAYDDVPEDALLKRLILLFVLLHVGFSMKEVPGDIMRRATDFIKESASSSILFLLSLSIYTAYMNPFLGETNRHRVEDLMVEIGIKSLPASGADKMRGKVKGVLLTELQKLRQSTNENEEC
jgi:predicted MPP superfamily phosphohydrolase